jgi:2-beta-glucuronyltransferase
MPRVVFVSGHYYESKRRAGFHWLAHAYWKAGWEVLFITTSISWLSRFRGDPRFKCPAMAERGRLKTVTDRLTSYVWFTPWHPAHLRLALANAFVSPLYRRYGALPLGPAADYVREADLVIMESTPGLMLFDQLKALAPSAYFIYRVSDDIRLLRIHPVVHAFEKCVGSRFDMVSSPCAHTHGKFAHLPNAFMHPHGINTEAFAEKHPNPYPDGTINLVFVGNSHFDYDFLDRASRQYPEVSFHIIGPIPNLPHRENIITYGEIPFAQTVPYIQHAHAGLAIRSYGIGAESLGESLKVLQYTHCHLPYIAPEFMRSNRSNVFCYHPGDDASIREAVQDALRFDRDTACWQHVYSWDELAELLARGVVGRKGPSA